MVKALMSSMIWSCIKNISLSNIASHQGENVKLQKGNLENITLITQ
jgi:DNA repair exonuclease SbcCD ATPase subunit